MGPLVSSVDAPPPTGQPCEFLGLLHAPGQKGSVPWPEHRCFSAGEPVEIGRTHQGFFCLTGAHTDCPRYVLGQNVKKARAAAAAPEPRLVAQGLYALRARGRWVTTWGMRAGLAAAVVLMAIGLEFAIVRPMTPSTARTQGLAQPATTAPQITTFTLQPPTRTPTPIPTPSATGTPATRPSPGPSGAGQAVGAGASRPAEIAATTQTMFTMQPGGGPPGSLLTIMGVNWTPNSEVTLGWGLQPDDAGHRELATARTNANGAFTAAPRLPTGVAGTVYISVRQGDRVATAPFQVLP
ncbi:MAG: hypothetical protein NZ518_03095 [Dehalococcoidia bacterium]|nr:hypothetical protein [Dehalococcoidia bacterium]